MKIDKKKMPIIIGGAVAIIVIIVIVLVLVLGGNKGGNNTKKEDSWLDKKYNVTDKKEIEEILKKHKIEAEFNRVGDDNCWYYSTTTESEEYQYCRETKKIKYINYE